MVPAFDPGNVEVSGYVQNSCPSHGLPWPPVGGMSRRAGRRDACARGIVSRYYSHTYADGDRDANTYAHGGRASALTCPGRHTHDIP